ncbi:MliC family protein [Vulcaniibacterium tengchongense]|nr:MliC family protein [Vulcaniibacterium tengchongense]
MRRLPIVAFACAAALAGCRTERDGGTARPVPAPPAAAASARAGASPPAAPASHWRCGEQRVRAEFDNAARRVALSLPGRALALPQAPAASGARYADGRGNEFWTKGEHGTLALAGETARECRREPTPREAAAARGVGFRAGGNEPGWYVEVGHGEAPALRAVLDYGERRLDLPHTAAAADGLAGTAADGTPVRLRIERTPCTDAMNGQRFPARAELRVGDRTYHGCGAFL